MPPSFQQVLNSRLFKFTVGEKIDGSPTEFHVHEEAFAALSEPLSSLMRGGMAESQAACAKWDDVSKETFERFAQFAYTGDYSIPKTEMRVAKEEIINRAPIDTSNELSEVPESYMAPPPPSDSWRPVEPVFGFPTGPGFGFAGVYSPVSKRGKKKKTKFQKSTNQIFQSLSFPPPASRDNYEESYEPSEEFNQNQDYSNVFLGHASLYVLGDFWLVDSLKSLALYKLHTTLCAFEINEESVEDILALTRYAYSEEVGGAGYNEGIGGLRSLVCQFLKVNAVALSRDEGFMEILGEGGQISKDMFKAVAQMAM
ncbi:hypothetical protein LARI1_G003514 [Lachnellula arida]|uniref:BTB domain-containing protein n=1 Tax=Lachnellula arida TaxID=1316785 RepID=A0A8T9BDZ5_9HELO|nr:hypothetical protein LARI1_G003514 [Lachnellula arida]